jgi:hypothetical protein
MVSIGRWFTDYIVVELVPSIESPD